MAAPIELRNGTSQRLLVACMMASTGLVLASDVVAATPHPQHHYERPVVAAPDGSVSLAKAFAHLELISAVFDEAYALLLSAEVPADALQSHPFDTILTVMNRGMDELKPLRDTGELGAEGDRFIVEFAHARRKAERNAHLIKQMSTMPVVYESSIDRDGLVSLSQVARNFYLNS